MATAVSSFAREAENRASWKSLLCENLDRKMQVNPSLVLLTGATGYVGRHLLNRLEQSGQSVRALARSPKSLLAREYSETEVVQGDVLDRDSLSAALNGVHTAYYLIHLMGNPGDFEDQDRRAAENFAEAAKEAEVRRIIYLGGLGEDADAELSPHLRSRHEVGRILASSGIETIEFRASVVVGSGSLSFELIRSLTDRLPVMICPRWLATPTQPIAVDDVLDYLIAALTLPQRGSRIYEIGSPDVVTYGDLIREYAKQRDLKRLMVSVPVLTPYLSSLWLALVTPTNASVGRHLIEGLKNPTIVRDYSAAEDFEVCPMGIRQAIRQALGADTNDTEAENR